MTFERGILHNYNEFETPKLVRLGDGHTVIALGASKFTQLYQTPK